MALGAPSLTQGSGDSRYSGGSRIGGSSSTRFSNVSQFGSPLSAQVYTPRGVPEAMDTDQLAQALGFDHTMAGIEAAARAPGYIMERPVAAASELASGLARSFGWIQDDQDILSEVGQGIRNIPIVGDHIGNGIAGIMGAFNTVSDAAPTMLNARYARIIDGTKGLSDDEPVPFEFAITIPDSWDNISNMGDLRQHMQEALNWTPEMMQSIYDGEAGWLDFAWGPKTFANEWADAGMRLVADPFNLLLGAGVVLKGVKSANTAMRALRYGSRMTKAATASKPLYGLAARQAIHAGSSAGVTVTGLGYSLVEMTQGFLSGPFAAYRKVALGTTAAQAGAQGAGHVAGAIGLGDTILGDIGRVGESIAENKPLSENDLYMLAMIFTFPGGKLIKKGATSIRKAPIIGIDNALWSRAESSAIEHMIKNDPEYRGLNTRAARDKVIQQFGGVDEYEAFLANLARDAVALKEGLLNISDNAAVTRRKIDNVPALGFHIQAMQRRAMRKVGKALETGSLRPQDLVRALDHFALSRGGAMEAMLDSGQATRRVSVAKLAQTWNGYSKIAKELDAAFEGGAAIVPGISDKVYTVEGLAHIKQMLKDELDANGMVSGEYLQELLMTQPALVKHLGDAEVQKAFAGRKMVNGKQVLEKLSDERITEGAWTFDDLWGETMRSWAKGGNEAAGAVRQGTGRAQMKIRQGEKLAGRHRPERGMAEVVVVERGYQGVRAGGGNPVTVGMVREARGLPENAAGTQAVLSALRQAGYEIDAATQIVKMDGKALETGTAIRMADMTDLTTLEQVAAVTLEQTGGRKALIIRRGTALDANGLERNAAEFQWDLPERLNEAQWDTLLQETKRVLGDNVIIDDTNGVVRVIITKDKPDPRLFAHLRAVTEATGVQPSVERLNVSTVRNARKPLKGDPNGTRTVKDVSRDAKSDPSGVRYRNATESVAGWRRRYADELGRTDGVVGSRGPDAPADAIGAGGTALDVGGSGARRAAEGAPAITRYESLRGNQPIGRRGKYVVDAADPEFQRVTREQLGADAAPQPGDLAFRSDDGNFGAVVRDGELRVWRVRGSTGDFDDFLAHVSEYATYVRVPGRRTKRGSQSIYAPDAYAEHGWRPVARVAGREGDVYLVRDVAGEIGSEIAPEIPPIRHGGWQGMRDSVMSLPVQQARVTAKALADNLHGAPEARLRIPEVEAQGNHLLETHSPAEIRDMYQAKSDDPAVQHAMRQIMDETLEEAAAEAPYTVARDVPPPTAGRVGPVRTYNLGLTRKTASGKLRSHRRNANEMYSASVKPKKAGQVTRPASVEVMRDPRTQLFLSDDGKAGAIVTADGDLANVFGDGAQLNDILVEARELAYTASYPPSQQAAMARHGFVVVAEGDDIVYAVKRELLGETPLTDATPPGVRAAEQRLRDRPSMRDDSYAPQDDMAWRNQNEDYFADNHNEFYEPFREGGEQITRHPNRIDYYGEDGRHVGYITHDGSGRIANVAVHPDMRRTGAGTRMLEYIDANTDFDIVNGMGYTPHTPGGLALMESFLRRRGATVPDVPVLRVLDADEAFMAQRAAMMSEGGVVPDDLRKAQVAGRNFGEGTVQYIANMEAEIANNLPKMHDSLEGLWGEMTPRQRMKVAQIERELKILNPTYTLKAAPKGAPTYYRGQGADFRAMVGEWTDTYRGSKRLFDINALGADAWDKIFNPVYAAELNRLTTNQFFNTMQTFGVDNKTSKAILRDAREAFEESRTIPWSGNKVWGRMEHLEGRTFNRIFNDHLSLDQRKAMQAAGKRPQDVIRESSGRIYRWIDERAGPIDGEGGNGALARLEDLLYEGKTGAALQNLSIGTKIMYGIWRFALDPRWYLINRFEADILMGVRSGTRKALGVDLFGRRKGVHARTKGVDDALLAEESGMFQAHKRQGEKYAYADIEESLFGEQSQAGWMDMRSLNGYIAVGLEAEGRDITHRFMREMMGDPANHEIRDLIDMFETEGLKTADEWANAFHEMLYDWDTKGVRNTLNQKAADMGLDLTNQLYADMLDELYVRHQQSYLAMQRLMRGNINRSNLERILNNPFLYWPISYQLKAGKWMLDNLFNRFGGRETGFVGAGALTHWYDKHEQMMETDPDYAAIFNDHPSVWRLAGQLVPMTPFDMGTYMARWTRYGANWVAGTIDEDMRDDTYPQDILSFIERSTALGPMYSSSMLDRARRELFDDSEGASSSQSFR